MKKIWVVPTLFTLGNGFLGFLALAKASDAAMLGAGDPRFGGTLEFAAKCVLAAMILDSLDGWVARRLRSSSELGAQLDSLCDAVTFGVAPGVLFKTLVERETAAMGPISNVLSRFLLGAGAIYALCAILRLARFNVENAKGREDHKAFRGLPSPGAALVVIATVLLYYDERWTPWFPTSADAVRRVLRLGFPLAMCVLGVLMVSRIGYPHFASKVLGRRRSFRSFVQLLVLLILAVMEPVVILFVGSVVFAAYGPVLYVFKRVRGRTPPAARAGVRA